MDRRILAIRLLSDLLLWKIHMPFDTEIDQTSPLLSIRCSNPTCFAEDSDHYPIKILSYCRLDNRQKLMHVILLLDRKLQYDFPWPAACSVTCHYDPRYLVYMQNIWICSIKLAKCLPYECIVYQDGPLSLWLFRGKKSVLCCDSLLPPHCECWRLSFYRWGLGYLCVFFVSCCVVFSLNW